MQVRLDPGSDTPCRLRTGDEVELVRVDDGEMRRLLSDPSREAAAELIEHG